MEWKRKLRKWLKAGHILSIAAAGVISLRLKTQAAPEQPQLIMMESTAYCYGEVTASGTAVREGVCAGRKDWLGKTAVIYTDDMELLGIYEILDTGGDYRIQNGTCIDIYMKTDAECRAYGRQQVYVQLIDADG